MKSVPFTGLAEQRQRLRLEIDQRIGAVLDHGQFIMGPEVREFEERLDQYCGSRNSICVANGTDALQIALMAFGVGPGDAVLVPSFTYTATAEVILVLGAVPVFVDIDPATFNLDPTDLPRALRVAQSGGKTPKAIIAVDLFGLPAEWEAINEFAAENGLSVVADAAQSFGASTPSGAKVGTLATITTTSFFPAKPLGCFGDGGAIFTDNPELAGAMRSIRVHGQGAEKYETVRIGVNSRLDTMQAAVLLAKISIFAEETSARNAVAERYSAALRDHVTVPEIPHGTVSAWAQYTVRVQKRDAIREVLSKAGVPTAVYYPKPMHEQAAYSRYAEGHESLLGSTAAAQEVLSLPMSPYFTDDQINHVTESVINAVGSV